MATLEDLAKRMGDLAQGLPAQANKIKQDVARTVNFDLLQVTPVDTGQAMSNWIVQNGSPSDEMRSPFADVAGEGKGVPEIVRAANLRPALDAANETIAEATPGQAIHITNNLPYIQALDQGHSEQAQNFVARAIILGTDTINRAKII